MKRATRWTRFAHRAIGASAAAAVVAAAVPWFHQRSDTVALRLATADLRSRAAEAALVARAWDEHRATGPFTRMQARQLGHAVAQTRREAQDASSEPSVAAVVATADALLLALRDLEKLPAPEEPSRRSTILTSMSDALHATERSLAARER